MKKNYTVPTIQVVILRHAQTLLSGSEINGGGNQGDYTPGTQESRLGSNSFWDDEE